MAYPKVEARISLHIMKFDDAMDNGYVASRKFKDTNVVDIDRIRTRHGQEEQITPMESRLHAPTERWLIALQLPTRSACLYVCIYLNTTTIGLSVFKVMARPFQIMRAEDTMVRMLRIWSAT